MNINRIISLEISIIKLRSLRVKYQKRIYFFRFGPNIFISIFLNLFNIGIIKSYFPCNIFPYQSIDSLKIYVAFAVIIVFFNIFMLVVII